MRLACLQQPAQMPQQYDQGNNQSMRQKQLTRSFNQSKTAACCERKGNSRQHRQKKKRYLRSSKENELLLLLPLLVCRAKTPQQYIAPDAWSQKTSTVQQERRWKAHSGRRRQETERPQRSHLLLPSEWIGKHRLSIRAQE